MLLPSLCACGEDKDLWLDDPISMEKDTSSSYDIDESVTNANGSMRYEIFVRSFYDSNEDGIGDLNGVKAKLPYIAEMGYKSIWLMPINPSPSYHGYDITDYYGIESDYGTLEDFDALVQEAAKYNIDIMMDMVFNHCSIQHEWFRQAYVDYVNGTTGSDSYADWFVFSDTSKTGYNAYRGNRGTVYYESNFDSGMPEFNFDSEGVRNEIAEICRFWIQEHGVKGFRLDAVTYYYLDDATKNAEVLSWLDETVKGYKSDFYMVGECYKSDVIVNSYYKSTCDSFFRFSASQEGTGSVNPTLLNMVKGYGDANTFSKFLERNETTQKNYNPSSYSAYFTSNHDQDRVGGFFTGSSEYLPYQNKAMASLMALLPGTSYSYYGEEIGLLGKRGEEKTDAMRRLPMIWSKSNKKGECSFPEKANSSLMKNFSQVSSGVEDLLSKPFSLTNHYKKAINVRNKYPFIQKGIFKALNTGISTLMAYKITSADGKESITVVHNFSSKNAQANLSIQGTIKDSINTNHRIPTLDNGTLTIGAHSSVVIG